MRTAFGVLGPLVVRDASGSAEPLGGQKARELLAALLLHRGQVLFVDGLVGMLWGDEPSTGASTTLRTYVGQVRRILETAGAPAALQNRSGGYCLEVDPDDLDAERFESLLRLGQEAVAQGKAEEADALLGDALALWRGDVLADLGRPDFAIAPTARLEELRLVAWEAWVDTQLALGRHRSVVTRLQALVDEHPFRERFSAQLMLALYRSGRQAEALAVSAATRLRLADELGLDPGPELRELETSMLRQHPRLDADPGDNGDVIDRWLGVATPADQVPDAAADAGVAQSFARLDLLEREHERSILSDAIRSAAAGRGAGVAVSGDAGTGKTTLLQVTCADGPRMRLLRGGCDPLSTPRPFGPFRDLASEAGLTTLMSGDDALLSQICEETYAALRSEPTVLAVEDIHWIDAASVDVLRFLARRVDTMPLAMLVTYRDHEIGPRHPARPLLGDLARLDRHTVLRLQPLSEDGVQVLVQGSSLDPRRVHELTGGNPFFVTEVAKDPGRPLPATVRDAVLSHTVDVTPEDFEVLQLVATAPDRLDERVLPALGVDLSSLRRLEGTGLLSRTRGGLAYRHELARQAIESTIPPGGEPGLHSQVLEALEGLALQEPVILAHHAVAARDSGRAVRYARAAAEEASRAGAHTEAAAFLEVALEHLRAPAPVERAELLHRLSFEQYMTSRLAEALDNVRATIPLWQQLGDHAGLATALESTAIFEYYNARRSRAEAHADQAAHIAIDSGAVLQQGTARATRGFLAYLRNELELATACSVDAAGIAVTTDDRLLALRAELVGTLAQLAAGDEGARDRLSDHIASARANGWDELASTGYSQLSSLDVEHRRLRAAGRVLEESLPFAITCDIPICRHWQTAVRSRVRLGLGDWDGALDDVGHVLGQDGMPLARMWPLMITDLVALRRGERSGTGPSLEGAWQLCASIDEPLRRLSVLSALAEVMWTTGAADDRVGTEAVRDLERLAGTPGAEWAVGELATWLARLGLLRQVPAPVAEPYRLAFAGRHADAAAWWRDNGDAFTEALTLSDSDDPALRARAVELLDRLGASGTAARLGEARRVDGRGGHDGATAQAPVRVARANAT
jgi:DNA-binding SARP family transcriptional activator